MAATPLSTYAAVPVTAGGKAVVTNTDGDNIRIRSGASTKYEQIAEAHEGELVAVQDGPVTDSTGQVWFKVSAPGGAGWMMKDYLAGKDAPAKTNTTAKDTAKDTAKTKASETKATEPKLAGFARIGNSDGDPVRLRTAADANGSVITKFGPGTVVAVKEGPVTDAGGINWYKVSAEGSTGWMMAQFLIQTDAPAQQPAAQPAAPPAAQPAAQPVAPQPAEQPAAQPAAQTAAQEAAAQPVTPPAAQPAAPPAAEPAAQPATPEGNAEPAAAQPAAEQPAAAPPAADPAAAQQAAEKAAEKPAQTEQARTGTARGAEAPAAPAAPSGRGDNIVGTALKYVGARYRYGGTGPNSFDCSGFVYYIMNKVGIRMGRDMSAQLNSGTRIKTADLQPGDLLFFTNTYKRGLSHAGIYIGNGKFVHAENERTGVLVSQLWSAYWSSHYYAAVRSR
jgi:cell wall-associated NlpC family hydrolase